MQINTGQSEMGWHRLETFIECPRKYAYRYIAKLELPVSPKPLALGSAVHAALAAYYTSNNCEDAFTTPDPKWSYIVDDARDVVNAYLQEYKHERLDVVAVEYEIEGRLKGLRLTRRLDLVVNINNKLFIIDHKTASNVAARADTVFMDASLWTQAVIGSLALPQAFNIPYGGFIINLIGTKSPFKFMRQPINSSIETFKPFLPSLHYHLQRLDDTTKTFGNDVWNYPMSWRCHGRYSRCDYYDLCPNNIRNVDAFVVDDSA